MIAKLKDTGLSGVCEIIASRMGLHFPVERWDMLRHNLTLAGVEFGFQHLNEFTQWLLTTDLNNKQIDILASYLTISETFFWRETPVFSAITDFVLPELIASKKDGGKNIRIWSAGCSSGEEAYSLAIALHKAIPDIKDWNVTILATDINPKALEKAASGIYSKWSFRNCPSWLKANYFNNLGEGKYEIIPEIKEMVTFSKLNLVEDIFPSVVNNTQKMDIIFCRNVLMYFTDEWIRKISQNLSHSLTKDGWFVVSSCELSSQVFINFTPIDYSGAFLYRKGQKNFSTSKKTSSLLFVRDEPSPVVTDLFISPNSELYLTILNSDMGIITPTELSIVTTTEPDSATAPDSTSEIVSDIEPATDLNIRQLANQGHLPEALLLCDEGIEEDKFSTGLYFLRASILQELDKTSEAIASLKQAIYLDPNFIMAHFALGNLFIRQRQPKNAKRYFNNVLDLLSTFNDEDILVESEGLSVMHIREIISANMQKNTIL